MGVLIRDLECHGIYSRVIQSGRKGDPSFAGAE